MTDDIECIGAVMLLRADGAVLLQHRDDKPGLRAANQWVPPGGHCHSGELAIECARREFWEETTYRCRELRLLTSFISDNDEGWGPQRLHVFWDLYDEKQQIHCLEGQAIKFITRERAEQIDVPRYILSIWDELARILPVCTQLQRG